MQVLFRIYSIINAVFSVGDMKEKKKNVSELVKH